MAKLNVGSIVVGAIVTILLIAVEKIITAKYPSFNFIVVIYGILSIAAVSYFYLLYKKVDVIHSLIKKSLKRGKGD